MAITHAAVKVSGDYGTAAEWNANHTIGDMDRPKNFTTLIVAASDSLDTTRADYVCDAVDDQDTINDAITALPAAGGRVSLLEGTYQITGAIVISKDYVSLVGLGSATIIQTSDNISMISATNRTGILIRDVRLIGTGDAADNLNYGIRLSMTIKAIIYSVWAEQCGWAGIYVLAGCEGLLIHLCNVSDNELYGLFFTGDENAIVGNTLANNLDEGLHFHTADRCAVTGNIITGNGADGMSMSGAAGNNVISGNIFDANVGTAIGVVGASSGNIFSSNVCSNNGSSGITIGDNSDLNIITSNQCVSNTGWGVRIEDANCDDTIVVGNVMRLNVAANYSDAGTNTEAAHNKT